MGPQGFIIEQGNLVKRGFIKYIILVQLERLTPLSGK